MNGDVLIVDQYGALGGAQVVASQLRDLYDTHGQSVLIVAPSPGVHTAGNSRLVVSLSPWRLRAECAAVLASAGQVATIIVNGPRAFPLAWLLRRRSPSSTLIYYLHGRPRARWMRSVTKLFSRLSDHSVSVAACLASLLSNPDVIHNCARPALRLVQNEKQALTLAHAHGHKVTVKFLGRPDPVKGLDILSVCLRELGENAYFRRLGPQVQLAIGTSLHGGRAPSTHQRLPEWVEQVGCRDATWIEPGDIVVVPSRYEASALVIHEAMARAALVVASNAGGTPEILDDDCGYLFNSGDATSLATVLLQAIEDVQERQRRVCNAGIRSMNHSKKWEEYWLTHHRIGGSDALCHEEGNRGPQVADLKGRN